jgi:signal transduction histidine kinase
MVTRFRRLLSHSRRLMKIGDLMQNELNEINEQLMRSQEREESLRSQLVQAQKMEALGTLVGGIAHEFNNLIQIILGNTEILLMDMVDRSCDHQCLLTISDTCRRAAALVRSLMIFGRETSPHLSTLDLNTAVEESRELLQRTIPRMVRIGFRLSPDLKMVRGDLEQVKQVIVNLVLNASDAMPKGGELIIETENVDPEDRHGRSHTDTDAGPWVCLRVSDTGHGMDPETVSRIFDPFFTTRGLANRSELGLAVVQGIVEMHSGRINCESRIGGGTRFEILFPVDVAADRNNA